MLFQKPDFGGSGKLFVEGDDLRRAVSESDVSDQVIGNGAAGCAGGLDGLLGEAGRFDGDTARVEQAFESGENALRGPSGAEHPGEFGEDDEGQEDAAFRTGVGQRPTGALRLRRVVVEEGARPDIGVGDDHRTDLSDPGLRTLAAFISSKVMTGAGLPA